MGIGIAYWIIGGSPAFQECIRTHKNDEAYHALREDRPIAGRVARLHLQTVCIEDWTDKHEGAIGALATIVVAFFTFTLWRATSRLWQSAEDQLSEFRNSLTIANQHAEHMANSVQESARAATAMEKLAQATDLSVQAAFDSANAAAEGVKAAWSGSSAADRTAAIMQDTAERQLRAYLGITTEAPTGRPPAEIRVSGVIGANLFIRNFGQTPAHNVQQWVNIQIREFPLTSELPEPAEIDKLNRGISIIHPTEATTASCVTTWSITAEDRREISIGQKAIYIYGVVHYSDIFGKTERLTTYRLMSRTTVAVSVDFQICDGGNSAT
jgi:hypothetical protein